MYYTVQLSSHVSVQGLLVESLANGDVVICDGNRKWRGRPVCGTQPNSVSTQQASAVA